MQDNQHNKLPEELIETAWSKMKSLLDEHKPQPKGLSVSFFSKKILSATAIIVFLLGGIFVCLVNQKNELPGLFTSTMKSKKAPGQKLEITQTISGNPIVVTSNQKNIKHFDREVVLKKERSIIDSAFRGKRRLLQINLFQPGQSRQADQELHQKYVAGIGILGPTVKTVDFSELSDYAPRLTNHLKIKDQSQKGPALKLKFLVGAGFNFTGSAQVFFQQLSIHPTLGMELPIDNRINLNTGISFFSSVHLRNQRAVQKEFVNNFVDDIYYKLYTTDVIKLSYIDIPVTINYEVLPTISIESGLQLSRLYKSKVSEKKESYDYGNRLTASSQNTFVTSSVTFGKFPEQVNVNNWDTRLILGAGWQKNRIRVNARYLYGLSDAIHIVQIDGTIKKYSNSYIGIDVLYLLSARK